MGRLTAISILMLLIYSPVHAECYDAVTSMNVAVHSLQEENVDALSLKDNGETSFMLFQSVNVNNPTDNASNGWVLFERKRPDDLYCLIGTGKSIDFLMGMNEGAGFGKEFGLPGSGKRRCNDESDGVLGTLAVRTWASKELGDSFIEGLSNSFVGQNYTVIAAKRPSQGKLPWIILESTSPHTDCYYSRGDDSAFYPKFRLRKELTIPAHQLPQLGKSNP